MFRRLSLTWLALATAPVLWLTPVLLGFSQRHGQSDRFLLEEDIWLLAGLTVAMLLSPLLLRPARDLARGTKWQLSRRATVVALAMLVAFIGCAGAAVVFGGYPLSRDEDMAGFGASILAHGQVWAPVPPQWRAFAAALEPEFVRFSAGYSFWRPAYLPVSASLLAMARGLGLGSFVSPALAAVSVLAVFAIARRLWPDRPSLALVAAILLATSSQLLITAMTPYAMTAHLAFNLTWLWLHLRGGRVGHAGALTVGFLATGLHQLVFHPLFVAPFVLQLWLDRRWRLATLYTLAYAAICLFWLDFAPLTLAAAGGVAPAAGVGGVRALGPQLAALVGGAHPPTIRTMAENLVRFIVWQNPLLAPLALCGAATAVRAGGAARALVAGIVLTTAALVVVMPYQGYGWGYRYWHGLLGSCALIAAIGWDGLASRLPAPDRRAASVIFAGAAGASLLILFPIEAAMAASFVRPYAAAYGAIRAARSPLVLVDPRGGWYDDDLVRNDPYLGNRPLVMREPTLTRAQLAKLCADQGISLIDAADAARFGVTAAAERPRGSALASWRAMGLPSMCGPAAAPVVELAPRGGSS